jgi:RimJ/RimL family protein N-acetyltransferase
MADELSLPRADLLTDGVVTLRRWRDTDAQAVFEACQDPLIARFIPIPQPYTMAVAMDFVARRAAETTAGPSAHLAIADAVTDRAIGSISRHGPDGHRAMFGYWLAPVERGRGRMTRALVRMVDWTLATTDAIRLELYTDLENDASGAVATRAGFEFEGVRRAWDLDRDGRPIDCRFYVRVGPGA